MGPLDTNLFLFQQSNMAIYLELQSLKYSVQLISEKNFRG